MIIGYENGLISIWDMNEGTLIKPFVGHTRKVTWF